MKPFILAALLVAAIVALFVNYPIETAAGIGIGAVILAPAAVIFTRLWRKPSWPPDRN